MRFCMKFGPYFLDYMFVKKTSFNAINTWVSVSKYRLFLRTFFTPGMIFICNIDFHPDSYYFDAILTNKLDTFITNGQWSWPRLQH